MRKIAFLLLFVLGAMFARSQSIQTGPLAATLCQGQTITINFTASSSFDTGNEFIAQLSNATGSFSAPTAIGSLSATGSGSINATIPGSAAAGSGYRIRVVASSPATVGADNGSDVAINAPPQLSIGGVSTYCSGTTLSLTATGASSYSWSLTALPADVSSPLLAVGLRRLKTGFSGNVVRIRRSSDNAEQDFGVVATGDLDKAAIAQFLNGSDGFVVRLYDQSGGGRDMSQTNAFKQPLYRQTGQNGHPMIHFQYGKCLFNTSTFTNPNTVIYAARQGTADRNRILSSTGNNWLLGWWSGLKRSAFFEGWVNTGTPTDSDPHVYTGKTSDGSGKLYEDGLLVNTGSSSTPPVGLQMNGSGFFNGEFSDCEIYELVVYHSNLSDADRNKVESSMWNYWVNDASLFATAPQSGPMPITLTGSTAGCSATTTFTLNQNVQGDPTAFGDNNWNISFFNSGDGTIAGTDWQTSYAGYLTSNALDLITQNHWCYNCSPSGAVGYQGCSVGTGNFSWTAKRKGFPCAYYELNLPVRIGAAELWVNGTRVWQRANQGGGQANLWSGYLGPNDSLEYRGTAASSGAPATLLLTVVDPVRLDYPTTASCLVGGGTLTPTLLGIGGGTFSSTPSGLSLNASTGIVSVAQSQTGNYTINYTTVANGCAAPQTLSVNTTLSLSVPQGNPAVFGSNQWNVYAWNHGNGTPWSSNYAGYYVASGLNFNSESAWYSGASPSSAAGYHGCPVADDYHSFSAKRQGFTCGYYQIDVPSHDDDVELWVNGVQVWQHGGCCDAHTNAWRGYLGANDRVEFRIREIGGGSVGSLSFVQVAPNTIAYGNGSLCSSAAPVTPVRTGPGGGNYSAIPAGLSINSSTGVIDPANSVAGSYTVVYAPVSAVGCPLQNATTSVLIVATPTLQQPASMTVCTGSMVSVAPFNTTGNPGIIWTNSDTSIGLAASGTGNVPAFTAVNTGTQPRVANLMVYPLLMEARQVTASITDYNMYLESGLSLDYAASSCATPKPFPGSTYDYYYAPYRTHRFVNHSPVPLCVTITYNGGTYGDLFVAAYAGSFNPNSVATNYLGDGGTPVEAYNGSITFSVTLPANTDLVLMAVSYWYYAVDNYSISVSGLPAACSGTPRSFTMTVNPAPSATISYSGSPFCANGSVGSVTRTGSSGGTYSSTSGLHIDSLSGAINPALSSPGIYTVTYSIAATATCPLYSTTTTVEILSTASPVDPVASQTVCNGAPVSAVNFSGSGGGAVYTWTNSNPAIGLAASGSGALPVFAASNLGNTPIEGTITVTSGTSACALAGQTFTITVLPTPQIDPVANQVLCANAPSGVIAFSGVATGYNWTNNNTDIGLPASGSGPLNFTALNSGNSLLSAFLQVTPLYTLNGTTCMGKGTSFKISVRPPVTMNPVASQTLCAGSTTAAINFSGPAGTIFSWTNDNTLIGLVAAGTGNIASFTALNATPATQIGTVTVTPTNNHCSGASQTFALTVSPGAGSISYSGSPYCPAGEARPVRSGNSVGTFSASPAGLSINAANGFINLGASAAGTYTVTFTVQGTGCAATANTQVTVLPVSTVNTVPNQTWCNGATTSVVSFSGSAGGYSWTNSNPSIGLAASGTGNLPSFVATNTGTTTQTAMITVTPLGSAGSNCKGRSVTFRIQVFPTPSVDAIGTQVYCRGVATNPVTFAGTVAGTTYSWTANNLLVGLTSGRGSNTIPSFTTVSTNLAPVSTLITVLPSANKCVGSPMQFSYTVNACIAQSGDVEGESATARRAGSVQLGPNPSRDRVTIWLSTKSGSRHRVEVTDQYGRVLLRPATFSGNSYTLDLSALIPGTYMVRIVDLETKQTTIRKVIRL